MNDMPRFVPELKGLEVVESVSEASHLPFGRATCQLGVRAPGRFRYRRTGGLQRELVNQGIHSPQVQGGFRHDPKVLVFNYLSFSRTHASGQDLLNPVGPGSSGQLQNRLQRYNTFRRAA